MKIFRFLLPLFLVGSFFFTRKHEHVVDPEGELAYRQSLPPVVFATVLRDSLSLKAIHELGLNENLLGTKVVYADGREARYFDYDAERSRVLMMLSHLPFMKMAGMSDTNSRLISFDQLTPLKSTIKPEELESAASFWNGAENEYDVYECVKAPYVHTVLINKKTNHVMHRIAFQA